MNVSRSNSDRAAEKAGRGWESQSKEAETRVASWLSWYQLIQPGDGGRDKGLRRGMEFFSP